MFFQWELAPKCTFYWLTFPPCLTSLLLYQFSSIFQMNWERLNLHLNYFFWKFLFLFLKERESMSGGRAERGRHRIRSRLQAPSCQHKAQCWAQIHEPWDHDLSQSQMVNRLSHPGAPRVLITFVRSPLSSPNHLPEAPHSNVITLGIRIQHMNFGGTQIPRI